MTSEITTEELNSANDNIDQKIGKRGDDRTGIMAYLLSLDGIGPKKLFRSSTCLS